MKTFKEFVAEEIKGWKHAHSDLAAARKASSEESNTVHLHRLNANGSESGMHDARKGFKSEEEADSHAENIRKLNPGKKIQFNKYVNGKHVGVA